MNFETCQDKSSGSGDGDKINFSTNSDESCLRLMSSVEDDMQMSEESCSNQEEGSDFSSVVIKCEEPETNRSATFNIDVEAKLELADTEMDSRPQVLNTANTNEQSDLVVNIKPEPFEIESRLQQKFVSNQGGLPVDVTIKYEKPEPSCSDTMFFFEETKIMNNTNEPTDFNVPNAKTSVNCDPLDSEAQVKQENEIYVSPLFSAFSNNSSDNDINSGDDRSMSVNEKQSELNCKNQTFQCDVCNRTFNRRSNLKNHLLTHTGEKLFQCDVCSKNFSRSCYLNDHKRIHTGEKPYQCDICNKTFNHSRGLSNHKNVHTGEKPFQCDICDKCFIQPGSLKVHKRLHSGEKPYRCDMCGKSFSRSSLLNIHKRIHTGEKPNQCDICNKSFTQRYSLTVHKRLHSGEKPYQCDICNKTFTQSQRLSSHKRTHTGERPYICDVCNKTFTQTHILKIHKRLHSGEKPYQCDICNKNFGQSQQLNIHKRTHTCEGPYRCEVCDQTFIYFNNLRRHKLRHN